MSLPRWDEEVVLRHHATGAALPARVGHPAGELLALVLQVEPGQLVEGGGDLEFTSSDGLHRLPAAIVGHVADEQPVVLVRVDGPEEVTQRRGAFRVRAYLGVRVRLCEGPGRAEVTTTVDVSSSGMLLKDPIGLEPGDEVDLELSIADEHGPVVARGRVVRVAGSDLRGIVIEAIRGADHVRLLDFVTRRERDLRERDR